MKTVVVLLLACLMAGCAGKPARITWYVGDGRCVPPRDDGTYAPPYDVMNHRNDYPTYVGADKPGWSCSYQRSDGVVVQFGDSRTHQEQWQAFWGGNELP